MDNVKWIVVIGTKKAEFDNKDKAATWFSENYRHGLEWHYNKVVNGEVVF